MISSTESTYIDYDSDNDYNGYYNSVYITQEVTNKNPKKVIKVKKEKIHIFNIKDLDL